MPCRRYMCVCSVSDVVVRECRFATRGASDGIVERRTSRSGGTIAGVAGRG